MPLEISSAIDYLTGGIINSRFFSNPIWIALLITIIIMIIIPLTESSHWAITGIYIFITSIAILFIYNSSMIKKYSTSKTMSAAAEIVGDLSYINNPEGIEVRPNIHVESYDDLNI